ncbi:MAG: endonuclease III [Candidatus Pacearchaeota archaeon]
MEKQKLKQKLKRTTSQKRKLALLQLQKIKAILKREAKKIRLAAEWREPWQVLIATILSAQSRDEKTIEVAQKLFKTYSSLKALANAEISKVEKIIREINFYRTKARAIVRTARIIIKKYKGKIPAQREELMKLPGVGRKVANVYLVQVHKAAAIGVDTHVAFLSRVLGWTKSKSQIKIEKDLEALFPSRYWNEINYVLVRFGRLYRTRKMQVEKLKAEGII